jgi:hypothetical protein
VAQDPRARPSGCQLDARIARGISLTRLARKAPAPACAAQKSRRQTTRESDHPLFRRGKAPAEALREFASTAATATADAVASSAERQQVEEEDEETAANLARYETCEGLPSEVARLLAPLMDSGAISLRARVSAQRLWFGFRYVCSCGFEFPELYVRTREEGELVTALLEPNRAATVINRRPRHIVTGSRVLVLLVPLCILD